MTRALNRKKIQIPIVKALVFVLSFIIAFAFSMIFMTNFSQAADSSSTTASTAASMKKMGQTVMQKSLSSPAMSAVTDSNIQGKDSRQSMGIPSLNIGLTEAGKPAETANVIKILIMLTVLSLAPAILILMTSFTRIVVVLSFLRQAIGTQQMPPNQLIIGLSLFLTFMVMAPTFKTINETAVEPYMNNKISQGDAWSQAEGPLRSFMFKQTREKDIETMMSLSKQNKPQTRDDVPTYVLIPSFILSELKTAFQMGFMLYLPFIVLDMVIAGVLMAMGMMMLPPVVISLPFKLLLFVLVDGWQLVVGSLVKSFG